MKKMLKRNQVIITALAIMIAVAGYLNFTSDSPVLETGVENLESEGAVNNQDDSEISAALEDSVEGTDVALSEETIETVDAQAADDGEAASTEGAENISVDENGDPIDGEKVGETVLTNASVTLSQAKLNREQTRSKAKDILLEIINNETLDEASKQDAIQEMIQMTKRMEQETATETQLTAKGFADSIVTISDDAVDVTLNVGQLNDVQRTQIEDIVTRKTGYELNKIVITTAGK